MIITTTGFFNTGSSAITHILKEFNDVKLADDVYEVRIIYDPDGIDDLRYHLIDCPHRQNSSFALKKFKKFIDYNSNIFSNHHYELICEHNFKKISYEYINSLSYFTFKSNSHIEVYERGVLFTFINRLFQKIIRFFRNKLRIKISKDSLISNKTNQYATIIDKSLFFSQTKKYIGIILDYCNKNKSEFTVVDQLIPPSNFHRYSEYLPNDKLVVFVVDRDPRDLYVICKYFLKTSAIPCYNHEVFCKWYKWTRHQYTIDDDPSFVHRIQFEDLIYNYNETRIKIANICGLDLSKCDNLGVFFDPSKSINNTQVWYRYPKSKKEIEYIQHELSEYCFDFEKYKSKPLYEKNNMFDC